MEILSLLSESIAQLRGLETLGHGDHIFRTLVTNLVQYNLDSAVVGSGGIQLALQMTDRVVLTWR